MSTRSRQISLLFGGITLEPHSEVLSSNATRRRLMALSRSASIVVATACLLLSPGLALAQSAPATPPMKTIGKANKPELIQSLIVMNSRGATLQGDKLTLTGVTPNSIIFSDRP